MSIIELQEKLNHHNIPSINYSINTTPKPDSFVIHKGYAGWECFYFDERGGIWKFRSFLDEAEACDYFWNTLLSDKLKNQYK